ncbi:nitric oxide synthase [Deinococcus irradiatisoli]|uniref:Nitric oxide synthase oxygenase n=1 Tax=Deinococcus irradiatisoli TaxID=2202254 RepID=A0A2Z3JEH5_9DEIO|nr:nitric oxide synthase oxygenase [Deinococcus irradiatisoli]AWN22386.1 nitric oxide synthase [Deinococcus irradiatisoli]
MSQVHPPSRAPSAELWTDAQTFLKAFYRETRRSGLPARLAEVAGELARSGTYQLTSDELAHGAKMAWRHSARCVGRAYWPALTVRDLRHIQTPDEVFAELRAHLKAAWNGGQIKALISVFGPGVRIINDQLIRYAGYGPGLGDPQNAALTRFLLAHGWQPPGQPGPFDVLPLAIEWRGQVRLYSLSAEDVQEVKLTHPTCPDFAALNLKWHALPVISDLHLEVGGLRFGCAPFNGWYLQTEIAARNLADAQRYDQLPTVARALGLETRRERSLWRDRALLELNVATLHSFDAAGVKLADHHSVSRHFVRFEARERQSGRAVQGRWSWLISPLSPATSEIWHRPYQEDETARPAFVRAAPGWLDSGPVTCPFH